MTLKVFDLFSGGGGFRQGAEKAGCNIIAHCEIDKWAEQFYKQTFNTEGELYYNDATKINTGELPDFDVLLAGFPCQAFSIAGKRQGFKDTRGTMFFEVARILRDKRPRYFILENVKGLLNHEGGKTFQTILKILTNLGIYSIEWAVLNSKHFGVPQNRERVFIVGYPREFGVGKIFPIRQSTGFYSETGKNQEKVYNIASTLKARDYANWAGNFIYQLPRGKNQGGIKTECLTITKNQWEYNNLLIQANTSKDYEEVENGDCINLTFSDSKTRRGRVGKQCSQTLQTSGNMATYYQGRIRKLTPLECFRLQGFLDEIFYKGSKNISDAQLYKIAGNSVTVNVVYEIAKKIVELDKEKVKEILEQ